MLKVIFACVHNAGRSQMAAAFFNQLADRTKAEAVSAGTEPGLRVHPEVLAAMQEIGIDISGHHSKHMNDFLPMPIETIITVCGHADQACPMFPGQLNRHHWGFYDPAHATGTDDEKLTVFRRVRDEIKMVFEAYADGRRDQANQLPRP